MNFCFKFRKHAIFKAQGTIKPINCLNFEASAFISMYVNVKDALCSTDSTFFYSFLFLTGVFTSLTIGEVDETQDYGNGGGLSENTTPIHPPHHPQQHCISCGPLQVLRNHHL
ncbi:hypothetical protein GOODEAATRI_009874 [Goodea atripinnis]|uniref:Uncharacterized protein n=1 Tax=Goodea atripinnis TaxID=208336 RepID=A0ABV0PMH0_9TELE